MAYGLEIKNDDANIIISDDRSSYEVHSTGSGSSTIGPRNAGAADSAGNDWGGNVPESGVGGWGSLIKSDFLMIRPDDGTDNYNSTDQVHCNMNVSFGAKTQRTIRVFGRNTVSTSAGVEPTSFNYVYLSPINGNNNTVSPTTSGYGLEVYDASGDVKFSSFIDEYFIIDGVFTTADNSGDYTIAGDTWDEAYVATFTAPSGADIYDYYVSGNVMDIDVNSTPSNTLRGACAVYRHSTRTITMVSTYRSVDFIVGRLRS